MKVEIRVGHIYERGLFAIEPIKKNEFICFLPLDYIQLDGAWYVFDNEYNYPYKVNFRYGITCDLISNNDNEHDSLLYTINEKRCKCLQFFKKSVQVIGVSDPGRTDGLFVGHIINDFVDMSFVNNINYDKMSKEFSNVTVESKPVMYKGRLGLRVIASKDIKKDDELYLSYGQEYWKKYSGSKMHIYPVLLNKYFVS